MVPITGRYKHPAECGCLPCKKNEEWSKTPIIRVRINRKQGIVPAVDWYNGRINTPQNEEEE